MIRRFCLMFLAVGLVGVWLASDIHAQDKKEEKGKAIELDGMKAAIPGSWKEEKPANRMRFLQFALPKVKDDKSDAELIIFKGLGGSPDANIKRWKEMFVPPEGKNLDDVAKVTEIKIGEVKCPYLDVSGTYKFKAAPFDPNSKVENRTGQRMLAIHYEGKDDVYHFRLVGPADTVGNYKQGFEEWLKALKK